MYFFALAILPVLPSLLKHLFVQKRDDCGFDSECFTWYVTFIPEDVKFMIIAALLIWPLVAYKISIFFKQLKSKQ